MSSGGVSESALVDSVEQERINGDLRAQEEELKKTCSDSETTQRVLDVSTRSKDETELQDESCVERENSHPMKDCGLGFGEPLFQAIEKNDAAKVRELIEGGASVNLVTRVYGGNFFPLIYTPLILAVENNNIEIFEALLQVPEIDVNQTDHFGSTVLHVAASMYSGTEMVQLLLKREDVDVNAQNAKFGYTALHEASINGFIETVRLLLNKEGIDVNVKDKDDGFTPLHHATVELHARVVELLLQRKDIDVNARDNGRGSTPLILAAEAGSQEVVKLLLKTKGIDVNAKTESDRSTALHEAAERNHAGVVELLLEKEDVNVSVRNSSGLTALQLASKAGHTAIVDLIQKRKDGDSYLLSDFYEAVLHRLYLLARRLAVF